MSNDNLYKVKLWQPTKTTGAVHVLIYAAGRWRSWGMIHSPKDDAFRAYGTKIQARRGAEKVAKAMGIEWEWIENKKEATR